MKDLTYKSFKKEALSDPETQKKFEALQPVWDLRRKLIKLRTEKGSTQEQLAGIMGTRNKSI